MIRQGAQAEQLAAQYLQQQGLKLIAQNYRGRFGEIDLIMHDGATLVFVEVKFRTHVAAEGQGEIKIANQRHIAQHTRFIG